MPFVLDNSVVMAWCFEDEDTVYADRVLELLNTETALAPAVWPLEVANALVVSERRERLRTADALRFVELLSGLPITVDGITLAQALRSVLDVARMYGLTSYDAAYLELAMRAGLPVATLDERLSDAARKAGIPLVE